MPYAIVYKRIDNKTKQFAEVEHFSNEEAYETWFKENILMEGHWWTEYRQANGTYACRRPR